MNADSVVQAPCPHDNELRDFAAARLPLVRMDAIQRHIAACHSCLQSLDAFDDDSDTIVQVLSTLPATSDDEYGYVQLRHRLLSNRQPIDDADCPTLTATTEEAECDYPKEIGDYEILELIGRGASGPVFRARHTKLDRVVALKLLNSRHLLSDPQLLVRFQHEMRAVGRLDHPHIVRATDAGEDAGRHYLVMEYVDGVDLSLLLKLRGPLRVADACELTRQAAIALQCAHDHKMVHRDVKPSNLFLTLQGHVKLLDLGLASLEDQVDPSGDSGLPFGTGDYMPPEQWTDFEGVDHRADIYSLGCTMYKLLAGKPIFETGRRDYAAKMRAHCSSPIPNVRELRPEVPLGLQKVLNKMLAKRPDARYDSADELALRLEPYAVDARLESLAAGIASQSGFDSTGDRTSVRTVAVSDGTATRRRIVKWSAAGLVACVPLLATLLIARRPHNMAQLETHTWRPLGATSDLIRFPASHPSNHPPAEPIPAGTEVIVIDASSAPTIVELGRPVSGQFQIRATVQTSTPETRAGIFFQYRPRKVRDAREFPFQAVTVETDDRGSSKLYWNRYRFVEQADGSFEADRFDWAMLAIPASESAQSPVGRSDNEVKVKVGQTGFPQVEWNQVPLPASSWEKSFLGNQAARLTPSELVTRYLGRFGVFVNTGKATFSGMQIAYLE